MSRVLRVAAGVALAAAAVAVVLVLPHWLSDARAAEFARAGCFFIAIVGLNLVTGYTGQISLGHGALMAVGILNGTVPKGGDVEVALDAITKK